jgi:hypothetical protein
VHRNRLSWRRLLILVERLPQDSATTRAIQGEDAAWSLADHLMAAAVDALNIANWQRSEDGSKGRNRPRPIPRPGVHDGTTRYGRGNGMTREELDKRLGRDKREAAGGN